jgi:hypothetical protein
VLSNIRLASPYDHRDVTVDRSGRDQGCGPPRLFGHARMSKLSVWWLRLGIEIERIKPGRAPSIAP